MIPHEIYMQRCFQLARKGLGSTKGNPLVGSVIVHNNRIIGEGWHKEYGKNHAEVNAVFSVKETDKHLLSQSTIYVNLEPCNHHGKTPPCVDLILQNKIPRVVICNIDPFSLVKGKGIQRLRKGGVEVTTGVLDNEGRKLNRRFFTFIEKKRPYVILKYAQSKDHFFAKNSNEQTWLTNAQCKRLVHKWRSEESSILVGTQTAFTDNPKLTNRYFDETKQPMRILIDEDLMIPKSNALFQEKHPTIIFTKHQTKLEGNKHFIQLDFQKNVVQQILNTLHQYQLSSVIIEGGKKTIDSFLRANLWDEARVLTGNVTLTNGLPSPTLHGQKINEFHLENDIVSIYKNPSCSI